MTFKAFCIALAMSGPAMRAQASASDGWTDVPATMRGVWGRDGRCDTVGDRLTMTADSAGLGTDPPRPVHYSVDERAVHWVEEYDVDDFVAGRTADALVHESQGHGMPGKVVYARCK